MRPFLLGLLIAILGACASPAKTPAPKPTPKKPAAPIDGPAWLRGNDAGEAQASEVEDPEAPELSLDINAVDEDVVAVIEDIRARSKARIRIDPRIDARISLKLREVTWRAALVTIAKLIDQVDLVEDGAAVLLRRRSDLSLEYHNANLRTVLLMLARRAGVNIILAPEVTGIVNARIDHADPIAALRIIAQNAGFQLVFESRRGESLRVGS